MPFNGMISSDLFPTKSSFVIFVTYMGLFINQGLLVTSTKNSSNYFNYNVTTVVLITEAVKLLVALVLLKKDKSIKEMFQECIMHRRVLYYYMIPAFLYCLYNNLAFINLAAFDPTTYFLLLQFRVVVTGIVFQVLFNKKLSTKQWFSLVLLTVGCIIKQFNVKGSSDAEESDFTLFSSHSTINLLLLLLQVFCSCLAGVYNEYLLKNIGVDTHIMIQNVYMYIDSIICNVVILLISGSLWVAFTEKALESILQTKVIILIMNNAGIGIITSLFLKYLNSILKTFASASELMFTAILSWIIFGIPVDVYTAISIVVVSGASIIYSQNPVVNKPKSEGETNSGNKSSETV